MQVQGVTIRLDRTRPFGRVYGERTPDDAHHGVTFWQDDLPFDAGGVLVPPDGRTEPWEEIIEVDGAPKRIRHRPLYDARRHKKLEEKLNRIKNRRTAAPPVPEPQQVETIDNAVNLEAWLRAQEDYTPQEVFRAVKDRYHANFHTLRQCVELLVVDEKLVPEAEVSPALMALIDDGEG